MGVSRASCAQMWGIEENSRGWRIWLIFAVFLGLIVNFIAVLGCLSPATQTIHLYKLQQDELLKSIEMVSQKSTKSLENPHLPRVWYWGMSGVCDDDSHCHKSFPPTLSLGAMVDSSLRASISNETALSSALAPWASFIRSSSIDGSSKTVNPRLHTSRTKFLSFSRASAALAVLALFTSAGLLVVAVASLHARFRGKVRLWMLYLGTLFDGLLLLASAVLAIYAMNEGPRAIVRYAGLEKKNEPSDFLGPGMYVLAAGVLVKFLAIAGVFIGFLLFGFISLVVSCLAVMCACACLAGGAERGRYYCQYCGWSSDVRPYNGCCPSCQW
ncbi:hypothetical protein B0J15DRAFT_43298 [Fusarium solani]|uniref:Uncharacterized protein n=1 Tax=Fusarium solani TaxID=169388 RepID=A0A9P9K795_FUSSL|nr:uncharacterized protein B0J15DRAFT_43298 [Fusarium solani]KAH7250483.1 hypothetical protein B0J15DRAFT_43298 [Fusarium solani]